MLALITAIACVDAAGRSYWHKADIAMRLADVCFVAIADMWTIIFR